jgi:D-alanyl-lipoteichoic acid acyltransferase DltB (MBOAT superfamily)
MIDPLAHFLFVLGAYLLFCLMGRGSAAPLLTVLGIAFTLIFAPVATLWIALTVAEAAALFLLLRDKPRDSGWRQYGPYLVLPNFLFVDLHPLGFGLNVETLAISFSTIRIFMTTKQLLQSRKAMDRRDAWWIAVAAFYLPALMVGPVFSGTDLKRQASEAEPQQVNLRDYRMVLQGLVLAILVNPAFGLVKDLVVQPEHLGAPDWTAAPLYFLQLFTAFWGQSLIAEHASRFFGLRLPVNFDAPWKAANIREFWSRWHRSMAEFVMQYIFLPLNLKGLSPRIATLCAFLFMGLWHNFTWGYALWGAAHGLLLGWWPKRDFTGAVGIAVRIVTWAVVIGLSYIANFYGKIA